MRAIRSDEVSYPGLHIPELTPAEETPKLGSIRDTGLAVETRLGRQQANAAKRQRRIGTSVVMAVAVLLLAGIGWRWASDRKAAASPIKMDNGVIGLLSSAAASPASASPAAVPFQPETPIFAEYGKLQLHLPVPIDRLTEIGFHQASYAYALRMKTKLTDAKLSVVAKTHTTGRVAAKQPSGPDAWMTGQVIRMWRNRPGRPDTAADVGALAGTTVLAPVSGTIIKIKSYKLYGKYPDYEVHIAPEGTKGLDLVMIHLTNLNCVVGETVLAGQTPIAKVRKLSDKFHDQLADYTKGGGDHVHIQVNDATYPTYKGLVGAVDPESASDAGVPIQGH